MAETDDLRVSAASRSRTKALRVVHEGHEAFVAIGVIAHEDRQMSARREHRMTVFDEQPVSVEKIIEVKACSCRWSASAASTADATR